MAADRNYHYYFTIGDTLNAATDDDGETLRFTTAQEAHDYYAAHPNLHLHSNRNCGDAPNDGDIGCAAIDWSRISDMA